MRRAGGAGRARLLPRQTLPFLLCGPDMGHAAARHSCVEYGGRLYLFGGQDGPSCFFNDLSVFTADAGSWSLVPCGGTRPMGRSYHSCVVTDDTLLVPALASPHTNTAPR